MGDALELARRLQAIAQTGLTYAESPFDRQRYEAVRAAAAELAAGATGEHAADLAARFADEVGHATPKLDARGLVLREGAVLLVREHGQEGWNLPGGWVEVGETLADAVAKEVREETGHAVRPVRLLALLSRDLRARARWPVHVFNAHVLCELDAEDAGAPDEHEVAEVAFFDPDALPPLSPKTTPETLELLLELVRSGEGAARFD